MVIKFFSSCLEICYQNRPIFKPSSYISSPLNGSKKAFPVLKGVTAKYSGVRNKPLLFEGVLFPQQVTYKSWHHLWGVKRVNAKRLEPPRILEIQEKRGLPKGSMARGWTTYLSSHGMTWPCSHSHVLAVPSPQIGRAGKATVTHVL